MGGSSARKCFSHRRLLVQRKIRKLINPKKNYPHITESYACNLYTFVIIFLLPMISLICFGIYLFSSKAIKLCFIIIIHIQSYAMSPY